MADHFDRFTRCGSPMRSSLLIRWMGLKSMDTWLMSVAHAGLAQHGYEILFAAVFMEAVGLPVPAALALLIAGGASAQGSLAPAAAFAGSIATMLTADVVMFTLGRFTGWWLLAILCRLTLNPESCMLRSADSF